MAACLSLTTTPANGPRITPTWRTQSQSTITRPILNLLLPNSKKSNLKFTSSISNPNPFRLSAAKFPQSNKPSSTTTTRSLFTGIVEEMGEIKRLGTTENGAGFELEIRAKTVLQGVHLGDSIAVNGTCLTVTEFTDECFTAGLAPETLRKTSLMELGPGSRVNLERAVQPAGRMGGHFVQGHVDGTGEIVSRVKEGDSLWVKVRVEDEELLRYIVPKGFIAVDGTSLTVVDVMEEEGCFNFMMVAYTQQEVVVPMKSVGEKVNLEVDILGKYVERLLGSGFVESMVKSS
ncbi:unnamed protein product [Linum tenue]|uniref:Riboflavin synthase n=2 Tax=Linum tenue TaxID=586396 RepID=A0AAV0IB59_9ROSI|nr:unnamed protein product [Linum tenue]